MNGVPDPAYILARRVLLDVLDAIRTHRESVILVGAQAVYFHTGPARIAVPEFTIDADLALDPRTLKAYPLLEDLLGAANFKRGKNPGNWIGAGNVEVDLLVSEALAGPGRRGAKLPIHGNNVARKAKGLEAALVDHSRYQIASLEPDADARRHEVRVAGPASLLVAKMQKIGDRVGAPGRAKDKDALDVLRLLQSVATQDLVIRFRQLMADEVAMDVTRDAIKKLEALFTKEDGLGAEMAGRAVMPLEDPKTIKASCAALATDLLVTLRERGTI